MRWKYSNLSIKHQNNVPDVVDDLVPLLLFKHTQQIILVFGLLVVT